MGGAGFWLVVDDDGKDEDTRVGLHEATAPPAERAVAQRTVVQDPFLLDDFFPAHTCRLVNKVENVGAGRSGLGGNVPCQLVP